MMKFCEPIIQNQANANQRKGVFNFMALQIDQKILIDFDVPAQMRDGTTLRANIFRPAGEGQWPVLLTRLPYGKDLPLGTAILEPSQVARRGYVVIIQDTRGRFNSEGEWTPMR